MKKIRQQTNLYTQDDCLWFQVINKTLRIDIYPTLDNWNRWQYRPMPDDEGW
jgi:hypothetical protein